MIYAALVLAGVTAFLTGIAAALLAIWRWLVIVDEVALWAISGETLEAYKAKRIGFLFQPVPLVELSPPPPAPTPPRPADFNWWQVMNNPGEPQ